MNAKDFNALDRKIDKLIKLCEKLDEENRAMQAREHEWQVERSHLVQRNEQAKKTVESMINRLKTLEQSS